MAVLEDGQPIATYPVSTSKFGLGDFPGRKETPLGNLEIARKIGDHAPSGAVFKSRRLTGEVVPPDAPGRADSKRKTRVLTTASSTFTARRKNETSADR